MYHVHTYVGVGQGLHLECSQVKKAFQCTPTMGESMPSLHRETTDSLICTYHLYSCIDAMTMLCANGWEAPMLKSLKVYFLLVILTCYLL